MILKKCLIATLAVGFCATTASADLIDLSGAESEGEFGDGDNTVIDVVLDDGGAGLTVQGFAWALSFQAFSPSWGSEARIDIESPEGTVFTFSGDDVGWPDNPGIFVDGGDTNVFNGELYAGTWTFTFYEDFDDASTNPDGIYHDAVFIIKPIPAPGAIALLGLTGLAARRRRRA